MIIEQPAMWLRWLYPRATWRMDRNEKADYLTFDDGPIPEATPFILDTLSQYGIKATFFMVGDNVRKYPELYNKVVAAGHRIGNHTFNHIGGFRHTITTIGITKVVRITSNPKTAAMATTAVMILVFTSLPPTSRRQSDGLDGHRRRAPDPCLFPKNPATAHR